MMDELAQVLASVRDEVVPNWSEARSDRLYAGVGQLRRRRRARRIAVGTMAALALGGFGYFRLAPPAGGEFAAAHIDGAHAPRTGSGQARVPASENSAAKSDVQQPTAAPRLRAHQRMRLADGSRVHVVSSDGELAVERNERAHIGLRLATGVARFDVVPSTQREFLVHAGSVEVGVVGTVFEVERALGRVRVGVREGKVRVRVGSALNYVSAGQSIWFDEVSAPEAAAFHAAGKARTQRARLTYPDRSSRPYAGRDETPRAAWRSLGQSGDYEGAYRLLAQGTAVEDDSEALMDAADAARLSGHPEAAAAYLRKVLRDHRASPVAPLAAFTLGRVLLERLGQPLEAASAFAAARTIAPQGSLAQDALAREVEAWSKAGHPDEAYQRAQQYVERYPEGRRLRAVQLYGGLLAP